MKVFEDFEGRIIVDQNQNIIEADDGLFETGIKFIGRQAGGGYDRLYVVEREVGQEVKKFVLYVDNT